MNKEIQIMFDVKLHDLNPRLAGYARCSSTNQHAMDGFTYYLLHYVKSGKGSLLINDTTYLAHAGDMFFIPPGTAALHIADSHDPWEIEWVGFTGALSHDFLALPTVFSVSEEPFPHLRDLHLRKPDLAHKLAGDLLYLYSDFLNAEKGKANYVKYISDYIQSHYMEKISIEGFAKQFGVDRRHMSLQFKKAFGTTIQRYIMRIRLDVAMQLLSKGYSVKEAATLCGFNDTHNFDKVFKREEGSSPSEWKKRQNILVERHWSSDTE